MHIKRNNKRINIVDNNIVRLGNIFENSNDRNIAMHIYS